MFMTLFNEMLCVAILTPNRLIDFNEPMTKKKRACWIKNLIVNFLRFGI